MKKRHPRTWAGLALIVEECLPAVEVPREKLPADVPKWIGNSPLWLNAEADGCCDFFVKYGRWNKVDGDLRLMLHLRSLFAADVFLQRKIRAMPDPGPGKASGYLEHFLTSGWYHDWTAWARQRF